MDYWRPPLASVVSDEDVAYVEESPLYLDLLREHDTLEDRIDAFPDDGDRAELRALKRERDALRERLENLFRSRHMSRSIGRSDRRSLDVKGAPGAHGVYR